MTARARLAVFGVGAAAVGALFVLAVTGLPAFGATRHLDRDLAVAAATARHTANVVSAVNFDQRAFDTLGEETILLGSVLGAAAVLRPGRRERRRREDDVARVLPTTRLFSYVFLPVTLVVGLDVVAHGQVTPGGGFQGGVVLATGVHLLYVGGRYRALERFRPVGVFEDSEAVGTAVFAALGVAGVAAGGAFLANVLPRGEAGSLLSAGTVPLLSVAVGVEVAAGVIVLLSRFLDQALTVGGADR